MLLSSLKASLLDAQEAWSEEAFVGEDAHTSAVQNAAALGGVRVLRDIIKKLETDE